MMRALYFWAFVVAVMLIYGLYTMKYEVQRLEAKLQSLNEQLAFEREAARVLRAEWSFLNDPERIEKLAGRYLDLAPVSVHRISAMARLPFKEPAARSGESDRAARIPIAKPSANDLAQAPGEASR